MAALQMSTLPVVKTAITPLVRCARSLSVLGLPGQEPDDAADAFIGVMLGAACVGTTTFFVTIALMTMT